MVLGKHRFYMPPEWNEHHGTIMEWPVSDLVWGDDLHSAREAFALVARTIRRFEPVIMLVKSVNAAEAREMCGRSIQILEMEHDDCWVRDNGPTFVFDRTSMSLTGLSWDFNAWGYKYSLFSNDDLVPENLCSILRVPVIKPGIVLEGGSIHTNGCGVLVTTEECLLNKNRNPEMNRDEIEVVLARNLGVSKVIWLPFGLDGDETDGHVDNVCCFIGEKTVLMPWTEDPACPNWKRLTRNREELTRQGFKVETLPQPGVILNKGRPLTLSYVNFAFANGAIIMPSFGGDAEDTDVLAIRKVEELFPGRQVIQLPTLPIIRKGGNIHCITQQIPKLEGYTCATLP